MPSSTITQLGANGYLTLAGFWPSAASASGWYLRACQGGALYVAGTRDGDAARIEFRV